MIRSMSEQDIPQVLELLRMLRAESPTFNHYPEDERFATANLKFMVQAPTQIMLVDVREDVLTGVMFGYCGCPWFSPAYEANEMLLAVYEEFRGSSVAMRLIKEFERRAIEKSATAINVGASLGIADELAERLYIALGYVRNGHGLTKRI